MKIPLKYRVLEVLTQAAEKNGGVPVQGAESLIGAAFSDVDGATLLSILAELKADGLIGYVSTSTGGVEGVVVSPRARATLTNVHEGLQSKEDEKLDARRWQIKSMILGYGLGFISGVAVMIVREVLFK